MWSPQPHFCFIYKMERMSTRIKWSGVSEIAFSFHKKISCLYLKLYLYQKDGFIFTGSKAD